MKARIMYKTVKKLGPSRLCDLFQNVKQINDYNLRGSSRVHVPMPKTEFLNGSFAITELTYGTRYLMRYEVLYR